MTKDELIKIAAGKVGDDMYMTMDGLYKIVGDKVLKYPEFEILITCVICGESMPMNDTKICDKCRNAVISIRNKEE